MWIGCIPGENIPQEVNSLSHTGSVWRWESWTGDFFRLLHFFFKSNYWCPHDHREHGPSWDIWTAVYCCQVHLQYDDPSAHAQPFCSQSKSTKNSSLHVEDHYSERAHLHNSHAEPSQSCWCSVQQNDLDERRVWYSFYTRFVINRLWFMIMINHDNHAKIPEIWGIR